MEGPPAFKKTPSQGISINSHPIRWRVVLPILTRSPLVCALQLLVKLAFAPQVRKQRSTTDHSRPLFAALLDICPRRRELGSWLDNLAAQRHAPPTWSLVFPRRRACNGYTRFCPRRAVHHPHSFPVCAVLCMTRCREFCKRTRGSTVPGVRVCQRGRCGDV